MHTYIKSPHCTLQMPYKLICQLYFTEAGKSIFKKYIIYELKKKKNQTESNSAITSSGLPHSHATFVSLANISKHTLNTQIPAEWRRGRGRSEWLRPIIFYWQVLFSLFSVTVSHFGFVLWSLPGKDHCSAVFLAS